MLRFGNPFSKLKQELDCPGVRDAASDYLEEDLDPAIVARLQRHLEACGPCQRFIDTLSRTVKLLRGVPKDKAPSEPKARIIASARDQRP